MNEIEKKFYDALMDILSNGEISVDGEKCKVKYDKDYDYFLLEFDSETGYCVGGNKKFLFEIKPHPKEEHFSGYIPDFAICTDVYTHGGYVVEIDEHEWHEKTKEQVRIDKEKDRAYLRSGYIPVRFTGYEVYHNARR